MSRILAGFYDWSVLIDSFLYIGIPQTSFGRFVYRISEKIFQIMQMIGKIFITWSVGDGLLDVRVHIKSLTETIMIFERFAHSSCTESEQYQTACPNWISSPWHLPGAIWRSPTECGKFTCVYDDTHKTWVCVSAILHVLLKSFA